MQVLAANNAMLLTLLLLCISAALGVLSAVGLSCGIELIADPTMSCEAGILLSIGIPIALAFALLIGFPVALLFKKLNLFRWWQFVLGATLIAVPFYIVVGEPFNGNWNDRGRGIFVLYLGSGALSGLFYWFFANDSQT